MELDLPILDNSCASATKATTTTSIGLLIEQATMRPSNEALKLNPYRVKRNNLIPSHHCPTPSCQPNQSGKQKLLSRYSTTGKKNDSFQRVRLATESSFSNCKVEFNPRWWSYQGAGQHRPPHPPIEGGFVVSGDSLIPVPSRRYSWLQNQSSVTARLNVFQGVFRLQRAASLRRTRRLVGALLCRPNRFNSICPVVISLAGLKELMLSSKSALRDT